MGARRLARRPESERGYVDLGTRFHKANVNRESDLRESLDISTNEIVRSFVPKPAPPDANLTSDSLQRAAGRTATRIAQALSREDARR